MWDYKVIAGIYALDGADLIVENPLGKGTLQRILDHYGSEGYELVSSHYDNINREVVVTLKRLKGAGTPAATPHMMSAAPEEDLPPRRGGGGGSGGRRRRSKAELDRLARED